MKVVRFDRFGGPEVLEIVDLPDPHVGAGQVRLAAVLTLAAHAVCAPEAFASTTTVNFDTPPWSAPTWRPVRDLGWQASSQASSSTSSRSRPRSPLIATGASRASRAAASRRSVAARPCFEPKRGIRAPAVSWWMAVTWRGVPEPDRVFVMPRALGVSWSSAGRLAGEPPGDAVEDAPQSELESLVAGVGRVGVDVCVEDPQEVWEAA
jgi:hypothetical protein